MTLLIMALSSTSKKDFNIICKSNGTNFLIWKEQIQDVFIQKSQMAPLFGCIESDACIEADWKILDAKARYTIFLHLAK